VAVSIKPGVIDHTGYREIVTEQKIIDKDKFKYAHFYIDELESGACWYPGIYTWESDEIKRFAPLNPGFGVLTSTGHHFFELPNNLIRNKNIKMEIVICLGHIYPPPPTYKKKVIINEIELKDTINAKEISVVIK
jgi:hypothetical protein